MFELPVIVHYVYIFRITVEFEHVAVYEDFISSLDGYRDRILVRLLVDCDICGEIGDITFSFIGSITNYHLSQILSKYGRVVVESVRRFSPSRAIFNVFSSKNVL